MFDCYIDCNEIGSIFAVKISSYLGSEIAPDLLPKPA